MGTYVNNLRLLEITTGDESGTWGTKTNTNLELIADAFGSGTEAITTNADTHTTTIADGAADEGRAIFLKYTGTLDSACTITIAPNTVNKVWLIENATSGSQNIIISQGSGANITIGNGKIAAVLTDGAGAGAAVLDAFADLELSSTLTIGGATQANATVTVGVDDTGYDVKFFGATASAYMLWDESEDDLVLAGAAGIDLEGDIDVNGTANLDVVDIDGAVDMASTALVTGVLTTTATQVATGGITSGSDIISDTDSTDSLGSTGVRWLKGWFDTLTAGTLTIGSGSVTDSSGAISFGNENLTTTGIVTAAGTSVFTNLDISGDVDVDGTTNLDVVDIDGAVDMASTLAVAGVLTGASLDISGDIDIDGTSNLDVVDIDGAVDMATTLSCTGVATFGDDISVGATDKIFLDGGNNTYITESAADTISIYTEGAERYVLGGAGNPFLRLQAGNTGVGAIQYYEDDGGSGQALQFQAGVRGSDGNYYISTNATIHSSYALMASGQDVTIGGALAKGSGSFKIDHPLPSMKDTHDLVHSFLEGPRADLIYRGSVALSGGTASVDLDEEVGMTDGTWELLCRDPQVFLQNETGWSALKGSVSGSTLVIICKDTISSDTVSWMVVAERQDEHMMDTSWTDDDGRPIIEPEKPEDVEDGS